jgi:H+-transporting ATPase
MIEAAAILSAIVQKWEDFTIILILLPVNGVIDTYQENSALQALERHKKKVARRALALRNGRWQEIDACQRVGNDHRDDVCGAGAQTYFENPIRSSQTEDK